MEFRNYNHNYYDSLCEFLIELNIDNNSHINWNWARLEWIIGHPECDKANLGKIGLWFDKDKIVGAAIYDMYYGEAFCACLDDYFKIYPEIVDYAYKELKDNSGLGIAICDDNYNEISIIKQKGFMKSSQEETILCFDLNKDLDVCLPNDVRFVDVDFDSDIDKIQWLFWQGFDHGTNKDEFLSRDKEKIEKRKHFNPYLSICVANSDGEFISYCSLWYNENTDYAYLEPVCTIPSFRNRGIAKASIYEGMKRAKKLGAKTVYVISDMDFYKKLGFVKRHHYSFYWKK